MKDSKRKTGTDVWGVYEKKGSDEEQNRLIDEWIARRNKEIGGITIPVVGEWPPNLENWYGAQKNEYIDTDLIRHYAESMGDRNPLWLNQEYARKSIWGGIIAPPQIVDSIVDSGCGKMEPEQWRKFNSFIMYPAEANHEWFQVMRPGDKIRLVQKFLGLSEVASIFPKPCREIRLNIRKFLINQREETVATVDHVWAFIVNRPSDSKSPYKGTDRGRRKLTDEERDAIYEGYDKEERRGNNTLYWEDVQVGDKSEPLVVGPISTYDTVATYTAVAGHAVGFAVQWDRIKLNTDYAWLDPEVNAWKCGGECHLHDGHGHVINYSKDGLAFAFKCTLYGIRSHAMTNWMGDDAFLRKMEHHVQDIVFLGEVVKTEICVINKYKKDDEHLVDVDVISENIDGDLLFDGKATVRLVSKEDLTKV